MEPNWKSSSIDGLDAYASFEASRRRLFGIAYRMMGDVSDAEDVLQEAWIRWQQCDRSVVREPAAFLTTITTRVALTELTAAHRRRETYIGPWLPSPVDTSSDPTLGAEGAEVLDLGTLLLMEKLGPAERAAFVLREAFDYTYERIADILESTEPAVRQLVSRARKHLNTAARHKATPDSQRRFLTAFLRAARTGDVSALERQLATDAVSYTDGGGTVRRTARRPIHGQETLGRSTYTASRSITSSGS